MVTRVAETKVDSLAVVCIQSQEVLFARIELGQDAHTPVAKPHDRFDHGSDFLEHLQGFIGTGSSRKVLKSIHQRVELGRVCQGHFELMKGMMDGEGECAKLKSKSPVLASPVVRWRKRARLRFSLGG